MKTLFIAASIFATALTFAAVQPAMAASADTCRELGGQVASAMTTASSDDSSSSARNEQRLAKVSCTNGAYANGAGHYRKALALLGK